MVEIRIDDYYELLALHRVLLEAKFHAEPDNLDIAGSPFVARLAERTLSALTEMERERGYPEKATAWETWSQIEEGDRYWRTAIKRAAECREWRRWNRDAKRQFTVDLLSPFKAQEDSIDRFIQETDSAAD